MGQKSHQTDSQLDSQRITSQTDNWTGKSLIRQIIGQKIHWTDIPADRKVIRKTDNWTEMSLERKTNGQKI